MKIDWSKVITNAVTVLVATVFMGAAVQLWNGEQTIDTRIDSNLVEIKATQEVLSEQLDMLTGRMAEILPLIILDNTFEEPEWGTQNLIDKRVQQQIQQR